MPKFRYGWKGVKEREGLIVCFLWNYLGLVLVINLLPLSSKFIFHCLLCECGAQPFMFLLCQLKQLHTLSLEDAMWSKEFSFLNSECSSHRFLDLWLLLFLVPAVNSSCSPHGWWHPAIKTFLDVPSGGLTMQCCSEALPHEQHQWLPYGQFYSVFWAMASLVDGFPWNNRERFSSKL